MTSSIRVRLLVILLTLIVLTGTGTFTATYLLAKRQVSAIFDGKLAEVGRLLSVTVAHEAREKDLDVFGEELIKHRYEYVPIFQVWSLSGQLLLRTPDATLLPIPHQAEGYADIAMNGETWRALAIRASSGQRIVLAHRTTERDALVRSIIAKIVFPQLLAIPLAALLIWWGVERGLVPLQWLTREITSRDEYALDHLDLNRLPVEVRGLGEELNAMFSRLQDALERYNRFTSDAAHELRSPLAGLRIRHRPLSAPGVSRSGGMHSHS